MLPSDDAAGSMTWMSRGACQREDPELFFPIAADGPSPEKIKAAKRVCHCCAVSAACLSFGLKTPQDGIWGGTTRGERSAMRKRRARVAAHMSRMAGADGATAGPSVPRYGRPRAAGGSAAAGPPGAGQGPR
jgi:WhiB family redox-sensing transcriptional regulator